MSDDPEIPSATTATDLDDPVAETQELLEAMEVAGHDPRRIAVVRGVAVAHQRLLDRMYGMARP